MIRLAVICLLCTSCGARVINPGAAREIVEMPRAEMTALFRSLGGTLKPNERLNGFYDRVTKRAYFAAELGRYAAIATVLHEVGGHAAEHETGDPRVWAVIASVSAPGFLAGVDGAR